MTLDHLLNGLRLCGLEYRLSPHPPEDIHERVYAKCPSCKTEGVLSLEVIEREPYRPVELDCLLDCGELAIRRALARDLHLAMAARLEAA